MQTKNRLSTALLALEIPDGIVGLFDCMVIAEQEIEKAKREIEQRYARAPRVAALRKAKAHDCFKYLCPGELSGKSEKLYRYHCQEIIRRVLAGGELELATEAEVIVGLSEMSLKSPLVRDAVLLYTQLFVKVWPELEAEVVPEHLSIRSESHAGAVEELLSLMRTKLSRRRG